MSEKRKDNKGRLLRTGESQRLDGRYAYKYSDSNGKAKFVYAWKLEPTDRTPKGKKDDLSLREKINKIKKDIDNNIDPYADKITLLQVIDDYLEIKSVKLNDKISTKLFYEDIRKVIQKEEIAMRKVSKLTETDLKKWMIKLHKDGYSFTYIDRIKSITKSALTNAVKGNIIRSNPVDFPLTAVLKNDKKDRVPWTDNQIQLLYEYLDTINRTLFKDVVYLLFNTGLRISEFCGLTIKDIDFDNHTINVNKQLQYNKYHGLSIVRPKSEKGIRFVPMTNEVEECFKRIIERRKTDSAKIEYFIDGVSGFVFVKNNGLPYTSYNWRDHFRRTLKKYNETSTVPLPSLSPHICRHTFCTNMAQKGMNPTILKSIMGHATIQMTLDYYTHISADSTVDELKRVMNR